MDFAEHNTKVMTEVEALIEKVGFGKLDVTYDIYGKKIVRVVVFGQRRTKYNEAEQQQALMDVLQKVKDNLSKDNDSQVTFVVKSSKRKIKEVFWHTTYEKIYEN